MSAFEEYLVDGMPDERGARRGEQWPMAQPAVPDLRWSDPGERSSGLRRGRLERQCCASATEPGECAALAPAGAGEAFVDWPAHEADGVLRVPGRDMPC